ncbi:MAG: inorganic triphosphatase [Sphingomonadaceae bacterium]|nr:inorganic triphosphatase [Sphingomonadaceae bacterium]
MARVLPHAIVDEPPPQPATEGDGKELELKLELDSSDAEAIVAAPLLGSADIEVRDQHAIYFDTPSRALLKCGLSLRIRRVGETRIQTVKAETGAAAGLFVRPEWEREVADDRPIVDDFGAPLGALVDAQELARLAPIFEVKVRRRLAQIQCEGATIELALDTGEISVAGRTTPVSEIELELKEGDPALLFDVARLLGDQAPLQLGVLTKSERGYRLLDDELDKPLKSQPVRLTSEMSAAQGFQAIARACLRQFCVNESILRRTGNDIALHQARVALRRLRSTFSIFREILVDDHFEHLRGELRWLAAELGEARNIDVLIGRLSKREGRPLKPARQAAYAEVETALASERTRALMVDLVEWIALGGWLSDKASAALREEPLPMFAGQVLEKFRRKVKRRGRNLAHIEDEARHELRIQAKKLRYATEFFAELYAQPKPRRRHAAFLAALEAMQADLGDLNDLATEPLVLARLGLEGSPTATALAADHQSRDALIRKAAEAHAALIDVKRFWH